MFNVYNKAQMLQWDSEVIKGSYPRKRIYNHCSVTEGTSFSKML